MIALAFDSLPAILDDASGKRLVESPAPTFPSPVVRPIDERADEHTDASPVGGSLTSRVVGSADNPRRDLLAERFDIQWCVTVGELPAAHHSFAGDNACRRLNRPLLTRSSGRPRPRPRSPLTTDC